jgi:hypothetical protein
LEQSTIRRGPTKDKTFANASEKTILQTNALKIKLEKLNNKQINNSVRSINATDHPPHSMNKWSLRRQSLHVMTQRIPRPAAK